MNWFESFITIAAPTGLITGAGVAWLNHFLSVRRERTKEAAAIQKDASFLAVRLAVLFDQYTMECAKLIEMHPANFVGGDDYKVWIQEIPNLLAYPEGGEWKSLHAGLVAEILDLRNEVAVTKKAIERLFYRGGKGDAATKKTLYEAARLGERSWRLSEKLRIQYALPQTAYRNIGWDFLAGLEEAKKRNAPSAAEDKA